MALEAGTCLGPYEIASHIGSGGMGEVYRARDARLGRDVAIKVLPAEAAIDADRLRRFENEARATGALNHPNVLAIYDVGVDAGRPYIVEELLQGQTLRELLVEGPLPPRKALEVAAQIAAGLAAAHDRGVVHRDLKPANLFLTSDGHAKILDFGLAKLVHPEEPSDASDLPTASAKSRWVLGTVGYMAPEQVRGQPVDHRADVFALGCVLYEMVSGRRAFRRDTSGATLAAILSEDPSPLPASVPSRTRTLIRHCLEKRPEDRFQSARDLAFALLETMETGQEPAPEEPPDKKGRSVALRIPLRAAGLALIVVGAAAAAGLGGRWMSPRPLPEAKRVAVLGFESGSPAEGLPAVAAGLAEYVTRGLTLLGPDQPAGSWTVPAGEARSLGAATVADLRRKLGATLVITGRLRRSGGRLHLDLAAIDALSGRSLRSGVVDDSASNLTSFQDGLVLRAAGLVGFGVPREAPERIGPLRTTVPEAFRAYLEATGLLAGDADAGALGKATGLLETATSRDPLFAAAWIALGRACLGRFDASHDPAWLERAAAAGDSAVRSGRWRAEAFRLLAAVETARGRTPEAVATLQRAARLDPASAEIQVDLAAACQAAQRPSDAADALERAVFLRPGDWLGHHRLAKLYLAQGKHEAAATRWREAIACAPEAVYPYSNLGAVYHFLGRDDEARRAFERSLAIEPNRVALSNLGTLYFADARFADAAATFERSLADDDRSHKSWGNLGFAYRYAEAPEKSANAFRRAVTLGDALLERSPGDVGVTIDVASYHAMLGERETGLRLLEPVIAAKPSSPDVVADVAECLWDLEDHERALEWVRLAFAAGVPRRRFEKSPTLRALVADPRYARLAEESESRP